MVQAIHSDGIPASLVDSPGLALGTSGYGGGEGNGVMLGFTTGLIVYCVGDSGLFGDMRTVVKDYYDPNLVVINISDTACLGPREGAYAINEFLDPTSVIPSHINEAATSGGQPIGRRLQLFMDLVDKKTDIVIPLSGVSRAFDREGRCVNCQSGGK
jgi:L-ascorbate metabolism protein UlaG (beta-lactamase superfamily)